MVAHFVGGRGHLGVEKRVGVSFIKAEAMIVSSSISSMSSKSTRETSFVTSTTVLKETPLMGVGAFASFLGVGTLRLLLK